MKHFVTTLIVSLLLSLTSSHAFAKEFNSDTSQKPNKSTSSMTSNERTDTRGRYEGTLCFSYLAGDLQELDGGKCNKKTTSQMYEEGWRLVQIETGFNSKIGFFFERPVK